MDFSLADNELHVYQEKLCTMKCFGNVFNYKILILLCVCATVHNFAMSHDLVCHDTLKTVRVNQEKIKL